MSGGIGPLVVRERERGLLRQLAASGRLVALLDPAGVPDLYVHLAWLARHEPMRARSLYTGSADEPEAAHTPWLLRVDQASLAWVDAPPADDALPDESRAPAHAVAVMNGDVAPDAPPPAPVALPVWAAGVYAVGAGEWPAAPDLAALRRRLARLLTLRLPEGDLVRFRLADARVLPPFLGACTAAELRYVYGAEVGAFVVAEPFGEGVRVYERAAAPVWLPRARVAVPALAPARAEPGTGRAPDVSPVSPLGEHAHRGRR